MPGVALAITAAVLALVLHDPGAPADEAVDEAAPVVLPRPAAPGATSVSGDLDELAASTPLWLDGTDLEVALEAAELFDVEWDLDAEALPATAELLPPAELEWIDELDGESLERVEQLLDQPHHHRGPT